MSQKRQIHDNKLKNLNKKLTSNKAKHLLVENKFNELSEVGKILTTKDYSFLLGRMYFTSDDVFQNMFVYQPTFNTIKYKNISH